MGNRTKKQHFVPQFYLSGFSPDGRTIQVFDKVDARSFPASIRDIAQESFFYDYQPGTYTLPDPSLPFDRQQVEKILSQIEGRAASILRDLLRRVESEEMTDDDILALAPYVAIQWMRTKEYRECMLAIVNQTGQSLANDLVERNWPDLARADYPTVSLDPRAAAAVHNEHFFNEESIMTVAKHLEDHLWIIGVNDTEHPFYTSDNPVVRRANCFAHGMPLIGIHNRGVEFAFPLTSRHILRILEREHFAEIRNLDGRAVKLTPAQVADLNRLQVAKCYRQVYCPQPDFTVAVDLCYARPELRQLDRPRAEVVSINAGPTKSYMVIRTFD